MSTGDTCQPLLVRENTFLVPDRLLHVGTEFFVLVEGSWPKVIGVSVRGIPVPLIKLIQNGVPCLYHHYCRETGD